MLKTLTELFKLLAPEQRKRLYALQVLIVIMAFTELIGIASIGPFMALVADLNLIETNGFYKELYTLSGLSDPQDFLFATGVAVLVFLAISSAVSIFTTWRLSLYGMQVGTQIADRLYQHYLNQNWLFHASGSSAQLTKQIATEAYRVMFSLVVPAMQMNSRIVLALFISIAIISYNPIIALVGLAIFATGYVIMYRLVKNKLAINGRTISATNTQRFRLMNEGFGGIKDLLLMNTNQHFIDEFERNGKQLAHAQGTTIAFSQIPRFFMELLAFGALITLVLVLLKMNNGALSQVLPILAVYALAGFKLLPALQQIYGSITTIKGGIPAFESIKSDLIASLNAQAAQASTAAALPLTDNINLANVTFTYPGKETPALKNLNLSIPLNTTIGLVGESGSGKSTAIDLILALIEPQQGQLTIGDTVINSSNKKQWQQQIGFVPQSIFLSEGSIAENIAFGLSPNKIDLEKVKTAANLAHLDEMLAGLPKGLDTKVGERGVQLSGGQRQRIGIARALYNQASVLVFDEATSALDGITENIIMNAINELSGKKTIIMIAHRLKTVKKCDIIYMLDKGKLLDQGTYAELIDKNEIFKTMAEHA